MTPRLYGILVTLGIVAGAGVAAYLAKKPKFKLTPEEIWDALLWLVIPGVIGARTYHVIDLWGYYRQHLWLIPQVWTGGLGIFGAIFGAVLGLYLFVRQSVTGEGILASLRPLKKNESSQLKRQFISLLDLLGVGAPLGQAIGRWGNYFNQELYGQPYNLAPDKPHFLALYIRPENRLPGYEQFSHFHPLFLYESIWNFFIFLILLRFALSPKLKLKPGTLFTLYLLLYSLGRFFLESLRLNPWQVSFLGFNLPAAQLISGFLITGSLFILVKNLSNFKLNVAKK